MRIDEKDSGLLLEEAWVQYFRANGFTAICAGQVFAALAAKFEICEPTGKWVSGLEELCDIVVKLPEKLIFVQVKSSAQGAEAHLNKIMGHGYGFTPVVVGPPPAVDPNIVVRILGRRGCYFSADIHAREMDVAATVEGRCEEAMKRLPAAAPAWVRAAMGQHDADFIARFRAASARMQKETQQRGELAVA